MSIREIINTTHSLSVGDRVEFTDTENVEHNGEIVEIQPKHQHEEPHKDWLVKSKLDDVPDSVLELWFDPEGGPIHVKVSFEFKDSREVTHIEKTE